LATKLESKKMETSELGMRVYSLLLTVLDWGPSHHASDSNKHQLTFYSAVSGVA
jgi:hypothetical protein